MNTHRQHTAPPAAHGPHEPLHLFRRLAGTIAGVVLCLSHLFAAGTPAGTVLVNQSTASYHDRQQGGPFVVGSNIVTIEVAQIAVVNLLPPVASRSARIITTVDYALRVVNSGNGTDNFAITGVSSLRFANVVYRDLDNNGVLSAAEIAAGPITTSGPVPADSAMSFVVRVTIPNEPSLNGHSDIVSVTATSSFDSRRSATGLYTTMINTATLFATKSVDVTTPLAGDRVTYTVTCTNVGSAEATNIVVTDVLDANLRFATGSASPAPVSVSGQTVTWQLATIPGNSSRTIVFFVDVVNNVPPTTEIHNVAALQYNDGPNVIPARSIETNFITVRSGGLVTVDVSPDQQISAEPGDTVQYRFVIANTGVQPETFNLSWTSTRNLRWALYRDDNGNGRVDPGEPVVTTTGPIAGGGGTFSLVARVRLPLAPADLTVDVLRLRVSSTTNPDNYVTRLGSTTTNMPILTLVKEVRAVNPVPGGELTYTISYANRGHGNAFQFVLHDQIPAHTVYVAGSVKHNGASKTDAVDADEVSVVNGLVTATIGTVSPMMSGIIEFKVKIQ